MGGKQSSQNEHTHAHAFADSPGISAATSSAGSSNSRSMHVDRQHRPFNLDSSLLIDSPDRRLLDHRFIRASSVVEGMRIPPPGFRLYRNQSSHIHSNQDDAGSPGMSNYTATQSLPSYFFRTMLIQDSCCPMCKKMIPADDVEMHFVLCLTKPRVTFNEETLEASLSDECAICLDQLLHGQKIARLPCLCIYHKSCIEEWFQRSQTCPEHPPD